LSGSNVKYPFYSSQRTIYEPAHIIRTNQADFCKLKPKISKPYSSIKNYKEIQFWLKMHPKTTISILSEYAISIAWEETISAQKHQHILWVKEMLEKANFPQFIVAIPSYHKMSVLFEEDEHSILILKERLEKWLNELYRNIPTNNTTLQQTVNQQIWEIPVHYGGVNGPDLTPLAAKNRIPETEVIRLHTQATYYVYMIGFTVGFPFLGGLNEQLYTPRKASPRLKVAAGSVGIGGEQTGVYPLEAPGGWQLIGKTDFQFFKDLESFDSVIKAGDLVQFKSIENQ